MFNTSDEKVTVFFKFVSHQQFFIFKLILKLLTTKTRNMFCHLSVNFTFTISLESIITL